MKLSFDNVVLFSIILSLTTSLLHYSIHSSIHLYIKNIYIFCSLLPFLLHHSHPLSFFFPLFFAKHEIKNHHLTTLLTLNNFPHPHTCHAKLYCKEMREMWVVVKNCASSYTAFYTIFIFFLSRVLFLIIIKHSNNNLLQYIFVSVTHSLIYFLSCSLVSYREV